MQNFEFIELEKINSSCINKHREQLIRGCNQEPNLPVCAAMAAGGGRKIKTQKGKKSRNKISRKHRTKKNSQKGGASELTLPTPPKVIKVVQRVEQRIEDVLPLGASVEKNSYTVYGVKLPLYCINIKDIPERNRRKAPESIYSNFMDLGSKYLFKNLCCVYRRNFNLTEWKFDEKGRVYFIKQRLGLAGKTRIYCTYNDSNEVVSMEISHKRLNFAIQLDKI